MEKQPADPFSEEYRAMTPSDLGEALRQMEEAQHHYAQLVPEWAFRKVIYRSFYEKARHDSIIRDQANKLLDDLMRQDLANDRLFWMFCRLMRVFDHIDDLRARLLKERSIDPRTVYEARWHFANEWLETVGLVSRDASGLVKLSEQLWPVKPPIEFGLSGKNWEEFLRDRLGRYVGRESITPISDGFAKAVRREISFYSNGCPVRGYDDLRIHRYISGYALCRH